MINSWTMCWSSIHRLAESPGVPTTEIVPSAQATANVSRPCPGGASATAGNAGNATGGVHHRGAMQGAVEKLVRGRHAPAYRMQIRLRQSSGVTTRALGDPLRADDKDVSR